MTDATFLARALTLVGVLFIAYLVAIWVVMVFWARRDIRARTVDRTQHAMAIALVAVGSLPGLLLYMALRPPETSEEMLTRQLEADALAREIDREQSCAGCGLRVRPEFVVCPHCRTSLGSSCDSCSRILRAAWVLCPYCGVDRTDTQPADIPMTGTSRRPAPVGGFVLQPSSAQTAQRPMLRATKA